jgi:hypothetical protein
MSRRETLQWGNDHSLVLIGNERVHCCSLNVVKPSDRQEINFALAAGTTTETVLESWKAQGEQWIELELSSKEPFVARRVIWLPDGSIMWNILHIDNKPYDTCGYTKLTKEIWNASRK